MVIVKIVNVLRKFYASHP